jgi:hypothetical protein
MEITDVGIIDSVRYPLHDPADARYRDVVSRVRTDLGARGCSVLPAFVPPERVDTLRREGARVAPDAYYDVERTNVYNIAFDADLPAEHPGRVVLQRGNAFVARDRIPADAIIQRLYTGAAFTRFVAACFDLPALHPLADPLSGLVLNVVRPGMEHPWHFDTNEFTVSMLTQEPADGGVFEYCPGIRSTRSENFPAVNAVLTGAGGDLVRRLVLRPGDLQLFQGRYALHRVSEVRGTVDRHTAIFAYSERPGVVGSPARTRQLFGRVLPAHLDAERAAVRVDGLLD